jgi:hypothetical protein
MHHPGVTTKTSLTRRSPAPSHVLGQEIRRVSLLCRVVSLTALQADRASLRNLRSPVSILQDTFAMQRAMRCVPVRKAKNFNYVVSQVRMNFPRRSHVVSLTSQPCYNSWFFYVLVVQTAIYKACYNTQVRIKTCFTGRRPADCLVLTSSCVVFAHVVCSFPFL